jgi:hypothetical protein
MQIDLSREELDTLRELLRKRVTELDKEINRTDSLAFKDQLHRLDRTIERILGAVSTALERTPESQSS